MSEVLNFINHYYGIGEPMLFYNGEIKLYFNKRDHIYMIRENGVYVPQKNVTSIVHIINKSPVLIPWACNMMYEKLVGSLEPHVDHAMGQINMPYDKFVELLFAAKSAHKDRLEAAATIGSIAHDWIEQYIKSVLAGTSTDGNLLSLSRLNEQSQNGCKAALQWMAAHNARWLGTEQKIYSRKYRYAGTMDGKAILDSCTDPLCCPSAFKNRLSVVDWKTSNALYVEYLFQTAAYQQADVENTGDIILDRWVIRLGKDDAKFDPWHREVHHFAGDFAGFQHALELTQDVEWIEEEMSVQLAAQRAHQRAVKAAAALEASKVRCKGADKYKGIRKPSCNQGNPCEYCTKLYNEKHPEANCG